MTHFETASICSLLSIVQALGLTSAWLARLSLGSRCQVACHGFFFVCLTLVGAATLLAFGLAPECWLPAGFTLSLMVVAVTCDFNRSGRAAALDR